MWGPKSAQENHNRGAVADPAAMCNSRLSPNGGCVVGSGLCWRSPWAKCLASVGSASHALHDIASCFAFWREGLVCVCNALENKLNETPNVKI